MAEGTFHAECEQGRSEPLAVKRLYAVAQLLLAPDTDQSHAANSVETLMTVQESGRFASEEASHRFLAPWRRTCLIVSVDHDLGHWWVLHRYQWLCLVTRPRSHPSMSVRRYPEL